MEILTWDPDFVFAWGGNYNLNVTSPCINAGDPTSPYDADLTIADIGTFPYYDPPVYGCIDSIALNYDPSATVDDGTCCFIAGCTDPMALNYDTASCSENNTCCYVSGCIDPIAIKLDPNACYEDGTCCFIAGCTDPLGFNYDPLACYDNGSCVYCNINGTFFANNPTTPTACDGFAVFNVTSYYPVVSYTWTTISGANISKYKHGIWIM